MLEIFKGCWLATECRLRSVTEVGFRAAAVRLKAMHILEDSARVLMT